MNRRKNFAYGALQSGLLDLKSDGPAYDPERRHRSYRLVEKVLSQPEEVFLARTFFEEEKERLPEIFDHFLAYFRDMAVFYETGDENRIKNRDYRVPIARQSQMVGMRVYDIIDAIYRARRYVEMNVNKSFAFEWLLLTMGG